MPFCIQCGSEVFNEERYCQSCLSQSQGPIETASATEPPYTVQPQPAYIPPASGSFDAPIGTPSGPPVNTPFDNPIGAPVQAPYGAPGNAPYGNPVGAPVGTPSGPPVNTSFDNPIGAPIQAPYGAPGNAPYGNPVGAPVGTPYGVPGNAPYGNPVGAPAETPTSFYFDLIKNLLIKPGITLPQFLTYNNLYPGVLIVLLSALLISLSGLLVLKTLPSTANGFIEFFDTANIIDYVDTSDLSLESLSESLKSLESLKSYSDTLSKSADVPYFTVFIKLFFELVLKWAILSAMILGSSKLFGSRLTAMQAFNVAGATTLYLAMAAIIALLLGFISTNLIYLIFAGGLAATYITLQKGIEPTLAENQPLNPYILPLAVTGTAVVNLIITKIAN